MWRLLLLLPLVLSCSTFVPVHDIQKFEGCPWTDELMIEALHTFEERYVEKFKLDEDDQETLSVSLSDITVECREGTTVDFMWNGQLHTAIAVTLSTDYILMSFQEGMELGSSAYFHELIHIVLWNLTGSADPDHLGDEYQGWTMKHSDLVAELESTYSTLE